MMERFLGLDMGQKRIGLAISDPTGKIALPLEVMKRDKDDLKTVRKIEAMAKQHDLRSLVVGLPLNMDGSSGRSAEAVIRFTELISEVTSLKVKLWDERLSTREAEQVLLSAMVSRSKRRDVVDKLAAQLILQSYIDSVVAAGKNKEND